MAPLLLMTKASRWSHEHSTFREKQNSILSTLSQVNWHQLTPENRGAKLGKQNIHLVHDPSFQHPFPVYPDIHEWTEDDFSTYFDIFASLDAEDQTWLPVANIPSNEKAYGLKESDYAMNIPRKRLHERYTRKGDEQVPVPIPPKKKGHVQDWVDYLPGHGKEPEIDDKVSIRVLEEEYSNARERQVSIEQF